MTKVQVGVRTAQVRSLRSMTSRSSAERCRKRPTSDRSRPNALTTRMPARMSCSSVSTLSSIRFSRRNSVRTCFHTLCVSRTTTGTGTSTSTARRHSRRKRITPTPIRVSTWARLSVSQKLMNVWILRVSLLTRLRMSPASRVLR